MATYHYAYDPDAGFLRDAANDRGVWSYKFDENGARVTQSEEVDGVAVAYDRFDHDAQDRLTRRNDVIYGYLPDGRARWRHNTTTNEATCYDIDGLGALAGVSSRDARDVTPGADPCGASPGNGVRYINDAAGRRIMRTDGAGRIKRWVYRDGLRPLAQLDDSGHLAQMYLYLSTPHSPDGMITYDPSGAVTGYLVFVRDLRGSIRKVVDGTTGVVLQELDYDPFGKVLTDTHPGFQPFGFAGGLYDPDTGLTRFGAREYDADTGRWLSKDPIGFEGGDTNLYGYVLQDPVNGVDPQGLRPLTGAESAFLRGIFGTSLDTSVIELDEALL